MVGDWVEIPAPLIGERLLQFVRNHKNHQQIVILKEDQIRKLTGRVQYYNQKPTLSTIDIDEGQDNEEKACFQAAKAGSQITA